MRQRNVVHDTICIVVNNEITISNIVDQIFNCYVNDSDIVTNYLVVVQDFIESSGIRSIACCPNYGHSWLYAYQRGLTYFSKDIKAIVLTLQCFFAYKVFLHPVQHEIPIVVYYLSCQPKNLRDQAPSSSKSQQLFGQVIRSHFTKIFRRCKQ